jgi:hypothetical protein
LRKPGTIRYGNGSVASAVASKASRSSMLMMAVVILVLKLAAP